jgi:hypothetical protein
VSKYVSYYKVTDLETGLVREEPPRCYAMEDVQGWVQDEGRPYHWNVVVAGERWEGPFYKELANE